MVSESSAIKWFRRVEETGSFAERLGKKAQYSPLEAHAEWLLALVKDKPNLTLAQIVARLDAERQFTITDSSVAQFFQRHCISFKTLHASEQNWADVARAREEW